MISRTRLRLHIIIIFLDITEATRAIMAKLIGACGAPAGFKQCTCKISRMNCLPSFAWRREIAEKTICWAVTWVVMMFNRKLPMKYITLEYLRVDSRTKHTQVNKWKHPLISPNYLQMDLVFPLYLNLWSLRMPPYRVCHKYTRVNCYIALTST